MEYTPKRKDIVRNLTLTVDTKLLERRFFGRFKWRLRIGLGFIRAACFIWGVSLNAEE